ncbi:hypothetical protein [Planctomycetes bacterium K23_9]|uniref:Uncharacterized protein n=1 Tax=Stieleria marina TaxID=1930275 RepID=A0A517NVM0_9BACT|nr:hypothetical protein K239x_31740 [Planctomycetes bacterium K23_9]
MSDAIALARLMLARTRFQMVAWSAWIALSLMITFMVGEIFGDKNAIPILILLTFPAMLWSLAMFEFGNVETAFAGQSGYSHWLMRLPLSNHTLALVPLTLRFVWIIGFFATLYGVSAFYAEAKVPFWSLLLVYMAGGVWTSVIAWRPCRNALTRMIMILVAGFLYYCLFACVILAGSPRRIDGWMVRDYPDLVRIVVYVVTAIAFGSGLLMALRSLSLARTNHNGLVPETKTKFAGWWGRMDEFFAPDASKEKFHPNARRALAWHDLRRALLVNEQTLPIVIATLILLGMAFLPLQAANFIFAFLLLTNLGTIAGNGLIEPTKLRGSSLPPYIAASPMTCAEIGFTRGATTIRFAFACSMLFWISYGICLLMPYNQPRLSAWINSNNVAYGDDWAGYRWMALVALACVAIVPSRILGFVWPTLTGRSRLAMFALVAPLLLVFGGIFVVTFWFLKQTDWESAQANALYWATWIPTVIAVMLAVKLAATFAAANRSLAKDLITFKTVAQISVVWFVATIVVAGISQWLIPDVRVHFVWTWMVTAVVLPIGRILILPYAVWLNRYR